MTNLDNLDNLWDQLLDLGISDETIYIVTAINGYTAETMTDILYAATGYRDFD